MANQNQQGKTKAGTNIQHVKQQNAQSAGSAGQYGTEFASESYAAEVRKQNAQSAARKNQASTQGQNPQQ
jgi:small acid-soluble spore protein E (minor gamma-type SASP)